MCTLRPARFLGLWLVLLTVPEVTLGAPPRQVLEEESMELPLAAVSQARVATTAGDTIWIADWSFDVFGGGCTDAGWVRYDNRILNDGSNYWSITTDFSGIGGITSHAAVLAKHDLTWARDGYGNDWDYSIILKYQGASTLTFSYLSDSEPEYDFVTVEADSLGLSEQRVDYSVNPGGTPATYRTVLFSVDGPQNATLGPLALPDFGVPAAVHEVYIRFASDNIYSDEDGEYPSTWSAGLVVDDIVVAGTLAYTEGFEGAVNPNVTLTNTAPATPFGEWARVYEHITDNDPCAENTTCAWLWSDPTLPAYSPDMAFGPGGAVVRNWLDDVIVSPWVSLASTPGAQSTMMTYRIFGGQTHSLSEIHLNWSVRSRIRLDNTDTSMPGDSIDAVGPWRHASSWLRVGFYDWRAVIWDMSQYVDVGARDVQVRFRLCDWQYLVGNPPPATLNPGPGPYIDRIRIGRCALASPRLLSDLARGSVAQDGFPSTTISGCPRVVPTNDRFGTCDFGSAHLYPWCLQYYPPPFPPACYVLRDSITMHVEDGSGAGITRVGICAAVVSGPHTGKAPPPWTVGTNGFFEIAAEPVQPGADTWFVDLDDQYFRGGDRLVYFWWATDGAGGFTSAPEGLTAIPSSIAQAQEATGGLLEVSYLPTIDWDPAYLARIAAHPTGKIDPTPEEIADSHQSSCILYVLQRPAPQRSGPAHRSAFMHTLNQLGYEGLYDVFYLNRYWADYNHHLASRATVAQMTEYELIIQDSGELGWATIPPGYCDRERPVNQREWYRDWLAQASTSDAGRATLWILGDDVVGENQLPYNPLFVDDMEVTLIAHSQSVLPYPNITGQRAFTWASGDSTDFMSDEITLNSSGCRNAGNDALGAAGTAVVTHRYARGSTSGDGAVVMNANPTAAWNTIMMSFSWEDLLDPPGSPPGNRRAELASKILSGVLSDSCGPGVPTDVTTPHVALPRVSALHPNVPNPFNPTTTIRFDLARDGHVRLHVYDVAGRRVRTLVDEWQEAGWNHRATWNGLDESGYRVASGIYLCRLSAGEFSSTRKMIVLK